MFDQLVEQNRDMAQPTPPPPPPPTTFFFLGAMADFEQCEHDRRTEAAAAPASNRVD